MCLFIFRFHSHTLLTVRIYHRFRTLFLKNRNLSHSPGASFFVRKLKVYGMAHIYHLPSIGNFVFFWREGILYIFCLQVFQEKNYDKTTRIIYTKLRHGFLYKFFKNRKILHFCFIKRPKNKKIK